jgi:tetratricopeptide (TPR) repeat protein
MGLFGRSKKEEYKSPADQARSYYQQGEEAYQRGKFKQAEKEAKKAIEIEPSLSEARQLLESIYVQLAMEKIGRIDEIIKLLEECIRVNPDTAVHGVLGRIYEWQGRIDKANQEYKEHLQINPNWEDLSIKVDGTPIRGMRAAVADEMVRRMLGLGNDYYYSSKNFKDWSDIRKSIGIPKRRGKKTNPS